MDEEQNPGYVFIDDTVTVVTYKSKTVQNVLGDMAGLLVLLRVSTFFLRAFHQ